MEEIAKLKAVIGADITDFQEKIGKVGGGLDGVASKLGGLGTTLAGLGVGAFLVDAIAQAREAAAVNRQLDAVLESTSGSVIKVRDAHGKLVDMQKATKQSVLETSERLMRLTGIDDDVVTSAQNILLTFTNIGKDVMPLAAETTLDMAAAMKMDSKSAAVMIGKALQSADGVTALTRAGVNFTKAEQNKIKALFASGRAAEAQKMILAELNKEFGGSAAAQADGVTRMQTTWGNFVETLGGFVLPIIDSLATVFSQIIVALEPMIPILAPVIAGFAALALATGPVGVILGAILGPIGAIGVAVVALYTAWQTNFGGIQDIVAGAWKAIKPGFDEIKAGVEGFVHTLMGTEPASKQLDMNKLLIANLPKGDQNILKALDLSLELTPDQRAGLTRDGKKLYDEVLSTVIPQKISQPLPGLGERFVTAITELLPKLKKGFEDLLQGAWNWLSTEGVKIVESGFKAAVQFASDAGAWLKANGPNLIWGFMNWLGGAIDWIKENGFSLLEKALKTLFTFATDIGAWVKSNAFDIGKGIGDWIRGGFTWITTEGITKFGEALTSLFTLPEGTTFGNFGDTISQAFSGIFDADGALAQIVEGLLGVDKGTLGTFFTTFFGADGPVQTAVRSITEPIQKIWDDLFGEKGGLMTTVNTLKGLVEGIFKTLKANIIGILKGLLSPLVTLLQGAFIVFNQLGDKKNADATLAAIAAINALGTEAPPPVNTPATALPTKKSALGNHMNPGDTSIVNERQQFELFTTSKSGWIVPPGKAGAIMGGSSGVTINGPITINGVTDVEGMYDALRREGRRRNQ